MTAAEVARSINHFLLLQFIYPYNISRSISLQYFLQYILTVFLLVFLTVYSHSISCNMFSQNSFFKISLTNSFTINYNLKLTMLLLTFLSILRSNSVYSHQTHSTFNFTSSYTFTFTQSDCQVKSKPCRAQEQLSAHITSFHFLSLSVSG